MHWIKSGLIAVGLGLFGASVAEAQKMQDSPVFKQMFAGRVALCMVSGRVVNTANWQYGNRSSTSSGLGSIKEKSTFRGNGKTGSMTYSRTSDEDETKLEINSEGRFYFSRTRKPNAKSNVVPVEIVQSPHEPISLTIDKDGRQQIYRAATFWHLAMLQPDETRQYMIPVLEMLRQQWQLAQAMAAVETELLQIAATGGPVDQQKWAALVAQLADEHFSKREAADRQLRAAGSAAAGYLRQLDLTRLDPEQQSRIRRILKTLTRQATDDTPSQVAALLIDDASVWLALLARPEEPIRRAAAKQLTALLGQPIAVDPAADPASQSKNRDALRARFSQKKDADKQH